MKNFGILLQPALAFFLSCTAASGSVLLNVSSTLASTDPTQLGRLSRSGVPSDWSTLKSFPGIVNVSTLYHYTTFTLNVLTAAYLQISIDDPSTSFFASAYLGAYTPLSLATNRGLDINYLGDAGSSGNAFGTDPGFFQIVVPQNRNLVVVINEPVSNGGIGRPFNLLVEGFSDTSFTDPVATPEPATLLLSAAGIGVLACVRRRRFKASPANHR